MAKILHRGNTDDGLMRGEGKFEILQSSGDLWKQIVNIERTGRICYRSEKKEITRDSATRFTRMIMKRGHESVLEHSGLTVMFSGVSRGFTHEMVRHRIASYSQESTRYVDYAGGRLDLEQSELTIIVPPHWDLTEIVGLASVVEVYEKTYKQFRSMGKVPQDARQFLPIGTAAKIAVSANFREWRHIMAMRTQKAAHWEIRYIMCDLLARLKEIIPVIFEDFYRPALFEVAGESGKRRMIGGQYVVDKDGYAYYEQAKKES